MLINIDERILPNLHILNAAFSFLLIVDIKRNGNNFYYKLLPVDWWSLMMFLSVFLLVPISHVHIYEEFQFIKEEVII